MHEAQAIIRKSNFFFLQCQPYTFPSKHTDHSTCNMFFLPKSRALVLKMPTTQVSKCPFQNLTPPQCRLEPLQGQREKSCNTFYFQSPKFAVHQAILEACHARRDAVKLKGK
jgi:hypothetical protein